METERLRLRPWQPGDAEAALDLYGDDELTGPAGRWAIEARDDGRLIGGVALLPLPPYGEDLELSYQIRTDEQRKGFAVEAARVVVRHAFADGVPELFVVARTANRAGSGLAEKLGFQWVGETSKYYGLRLQSYRLRAADLT